MAKKKAIVITFGRFQPPTSGHGELFDYVASIAAKNGADSLIFPSVSQDPKKNPLPFKEKVGFLKAMFPGRSFNDNPKITNPWLAWEALATSGYTHIYMCAAGERIADFQTMAKSFMKGVKKFPAMRGLERIEVLDSGERTPGISGTAMRNLATSGDFKKFAAGVGTRNQTLVKQLYTSLRKHMNLTESLARPSAFLFYNAPSELVENVAVRAGIDQITFADMLRAVTKVRNVVEMRDSFVMDMSKLSFTDIRSAHALIESWGYRPTIFVGRNMSSLAEERVQTSATRGLIWTQLARDVMMLETEQTTYQHVMTLLGEGDVVSAPKQPSEVDRLKAKQKQDVVMTKQRQAMELLQAKQRELQKKTREDMNKITQGEKPRSVTR